MLSQFVTESQHRDFDKKYGEIKKNQLQEKIKRKKLESKKFLTVI